MIKKGSFNKISIFTTILVAFFAMTGASRVFADGANLIQNPQLAADPSNVALPLGWGFGFNGNNNASSTYPAIGPNASTTGAQVTISSYTNGFADWYSNPIPMTPLAKYHYSDSYLSNASGIIEAVYTTVDSITGTSTVYIDLAYIPTTGGSWANANVTFVAPLGATSLTIFHLINNAGSLTIASPSLIKTADPVVMPADGSNLISNPAFISDPFSPAIPKYWKFSTYGTSAVISGYPAPGPDANTKGLKTTITSYTGGFADWYSNPISIVPFAEYKFSDSYLSDATGIIEAQFTVTDSITGAVTNLYTDLAYISPSGESWATSSVTFIAPAGATSVMVYHLINNAGSLTIANPSLIKTSDPATFSQGMVSLTFDDGNQTNYDKVFPVLKTAGIPGTFYIISQSMLDAAQIGTSTGDINNDYMTAGEVMEINRAGNEIGNHTVNHCNLTTGLCPDAEIPNSPDSLNAVQEIVQASTTLHQIGALPLDTFAYPYGAYNQTIENDVQNAGLISGRSVDRGYNLTNSNRYALKIQYVTASSTTLADFQTNIKPWIDTAMQNHVWLILLMHQIEPASMIATEHNPDSTTPEVLQAIVDYLKQNNVSVVTVHDGVCKMAGMAGDPRCSAPTVPGPAASSTATTTPDTHGDGHSDHGDSGHNGNNSEDHGCNNGHGDKNKNTPPTITLLGANPFSLTVNTPFIDPGATATDTEDGDLTSHIIVTGTVDASTTGSYILTYSITDSGGLSASTTRTVVVNPVICTSNCGGGEPANTPPTITLIGANPLNLIVGDIFIDPGATATDLEDGDATTTSHIIVTGSVDASTTGSYILTYSVTDSGGLSASTTRTVVVSATTTPPIDPPPVNPPANNGGGGGSSSAQPRLGGHRHPIAMAGGKVLGATSCSYLRDHLKIDWQNDPIEVLKLQSFLNVFEKENLSLTGKFDQTTFEAVQRFQIKYTGDILTPWGPKVTTGFVYILTKKKVNEIYCNSPFPVTQTEQNEINSFSSSLI